MTVDNRERPQVRNDTVNLRMGPGGAMRRGGGPGGPMGARIQAEKPKDMKKTLGRLLKYIGRHSILLVILIFVMLVTAAVTLISPILQGEAIDRVDTGDMQGLVRLLIVMGATFLLSAGMTYLQGLVSARLAQKTVYEMRRDLFRQITYLPIRFVDTHQHGDIMSRLTNDVDNIATSVSQSVATLFSGVITLLGSLAIMLYYSPLLTLVAVVTVPLTVLISTLLARVMRKLFVEQQRLLGSLNGEIEEMVTGYKTVMAYGREQSAIRDFSVINGRLKTAGIKANIFGSVMGPIMNALGNLGFLLVAVAGGWLALSGAITIGVIHSFIQYSRHFTRPINEIANQYSQILTAIAGAERVFEIMDGEAEQKDEGKQLDESALRGAIRFRNVDFAYRPETPILRQFDLDVAPGQRVAIVGRTGSGKTTVVNLLTRFYEVNGGSVELDGTDIRELNRQSLRGAIGMVLQDTVLFSDSIAQNIRYGDPNATDEEVRAAAQAAGADVFIERLPDGYNTLLTEAGGNLSQGQRQLLAIARAILSKPKILILDEATSSVDTRTEMQIQLGMLKLMEGRTSLVIAHRLSTIRDSDVIVVLDDGHIVESGDHDTLLAKKGVYYDLYMTQFSGVAT